MEAKGWDVNNQNNLNDRVTRLFVTTTNQSDHPKKSKIMKLLVDTNITYKLNDINRFNSVSKNNKVDFIFKLVLLKSIFRYLDNPLYARIVLGDEYDKINKRSKKSLGDTIYQKSKKVINHLETMNISSIEKIHNILHNRRHNHLYNLKPIENEQGFIYSLLNPTIKNIRNRANRSFNLSAVNIFIKDLKEHGLNYYADMFEKLNKLSSNIQNEYDGGFLFLNPQALKNYINRHIGVCHMLNGVNSPEHARIIAATYLPGLRNQLKHIENSNMTYKNPKLRQTKKNIYVLICLTLGSN